MNQRLVYLHKSLNKCVWSARQCTLSSHSFGCPLIQHHHEPEAPLLFPLLSTAPHPCWSMYSQHILYSKRQTSTHSFCYMYNDFMWFCSIVIQARPKKHRNKHRHRHRDHDHGRYRPGRHKQPKRDKYEDIINGKCFFIFMLRRQVKSILFIKPRVTSRTFLWCLISCKKAMTTWLLFFRHLLWDPGKNWGWRWRRRRELRLGSRSSGARW